MLKKTNKVSILGKLILSSVVVFGLGLSAFATQNKLSAVEVNNSSNGYQVILRADKPTIVRKNIQSPDEILITVKGIVPVESVATIYNDVPDVESVMIEPDAKDNVKILVHGKDVYKTNVAFGAPVIQAENSIADETTGTSDEALTDDSTAQSSENIQPKEAVELAAPIDAYSPVYEQGSEYEPESQQPSYEDMAKSAARMTVSVMKNASPLAKRIYHRLAKVDKKLLGLGGLFMIIIFAGMASLGGSKDNERKIGLAQSLKENEIPSAMPVAQKAARVNPSLPRTQTSPIAKVSPSMNYGLKAYNQSQKNPYTQESYGYATPNPVSKQTVPNPSLQRRTVTQDEIARNLAMLKQQQRFAQSPVTQPKMAPNPKIKMAQRQEAGIQANSVDSIKFLESMAKIYERSGREDLAKGLKSNIQRMKASSLQESVS